MVQKKNTFGVLAHGLIIWSMAADGRLCRRRRRRRAHAPTSNTASHDNHEKINSTVDVMMARAKRIYILIIKVNKLFSSGR